ncbi:GSU2403 family nucleotidyltransferase fold protein [Rhizobium sp. LjRoot258]|uniref:GSU2403 family nucleotidyltransferase fold protein n=1 Tax=Rhizobium sp. LjRoot258 TaxID=3342299 RepID=UPI003ECCE13A
MNIAFADLVESAHEKAFNARFPVKGTFHKLKRGEKEYWYHVMRDSTVTSGRRTSYAGLVGDPDVDALVERHGHEHARHRLQKETASMLRRSGLPAPDPMEGKLTQAFQRAGLFQAGAILVGSVAYQAYGGILGAKLSGDLHRTQDIDLAQDREIALHVGHTGQKLEDFQDILKSVDASFARKLNPSYPNAGPTRYENASKYKVDLLTAHENSDRDRRAPVAIPIMPGAALQPLDLMEFLIRNPIRSALLYEDGVAVVVPDPVRYALHKVTIGQMQGPSGEAGKDSKDRMQAAELVRAIEHAGRTSELAEAWSELWRDKAKRRRFVLRGVLALPDDAIDIIARTAIRYGEEPFRDGEPPAVTLRNLIR